MFWLEQEHYKKWTTKIINWKYKGWNKKLLRDE